MKNEFSEPLFIKISMLPIRCFSCNKVLANKGTTFTTLRNEKVPMNIIWEKLGLTRMCCRSIMIGHVDVSEELMAYCDYNPSKYIEIRKHPPTESGPTITVIDPDDLSLEDLSLEDSTSSTSSTSSTILSPVLKKGVRVYRAV